MDQDRWKTVNHIFHAALDVSSSERHAFVATAAEGDPELQAEVELLLKADEEAGSYIESPVIAGDVFSNSLPPLQPGEVLCRRFRIVRAVAEGGMGHVFEAFDSELAMPVALKVIRPEIAANPEALARFRQEVRLARSITHPNVCRTFDIEREPRIDPASGAKHDVVFLTMELLAGENLAARIKRAGPIALDEALQIARQVADGLTAAHSLGIIHRDIKPANIMLVPGENASTAGCRAVITDFGLARLDPVISSPHQSALSHTARPIGTLAYMAPEQLEGGRASPATDVYAFGLVLFEMVTGRRAFPSENFLSGIAQRLTGPPPDPQALVPDLPENWRRGIAGCLCTSPADRLQSAGDVVTLLEGGKGKVPALRREVRLSSHPRRRIAVYAAIFVAALALLAAGFRLYQSRADSRVAPGALVYLTQVKNQTGEKSLDNLTELIQAGLAQSTQVNLLDQARVGDILQQMTKPPETTIDEPVAREIAMRAGAVRVVFATVTGSAGNYKLDVDIQQPDNTPSRYRDHWTKSFAWRSAAAAAGGSIAPDLLKTVRDASDWIRHQAGESAHDIASLDDPPEDVTTSSWQALAEYAHAEALAAEGKRDEAIGALQAAVKFDSGFALAYARLGDIEINLARRSDGYAAYEEALGQNIRRLSVRERDRIKGIYALDTGDFETAEKAFRHSTSTYEHDYLSWFYRGYPLAMLGRDPEAITALEQAHAIAPGKNSPLLALAEESLAVGEVETARQWEQKLRAVGSTEWADDASGLIDFATGDLAGAQRSFQSMASSPQPMVHADALRLQADLAAEQGQYDYAIEILTRSLADPSELGLKLLDRAYLEGKVGNLKHAVADVHAAIENDDSPDAIATASEVLGRLLASAKKASAPELAAQIELLGRRLPDPDVGTISQIARLRARGELLLAQGKCEAALKQFHDAGQLEAPARGRDYLGRAFEAKAREESDRAAARQDLENALDAYGRIATRESEVWRIPTLSLPGSYADALQDWLRVAGALGMKKDDLDGIDTKLSKLRPASLIEKAHAGR
jgi:tetratricopeptide (TPR) repeat protein